ncbi:MAG: SGNH/GDSL hydrolase family protein [Bacteroides sp.]|nr:SGNH/GDSL hydrolase family protein [Bacteroides sp.]MBP9553683.1 SGNH/GDSL hydrolase family protein [Bacteroides sp.]
MDTSNINGGKIMLSNFRLKSLLCLLLYASGMSSQDKLPQKAARNLISRIPKPALKVKWPADTIPYTQLLPESFRNVKSNEIVDSTDVLEPVMKQLHEMRLDMEVDTFRILHIGDSHVRGHIYPQSAGLVLTQEFHSLLYYDMGVNGATCLTFTHPARISAIVEAKPSLLILSFGTNESHGKGYKTNVHYNQMHELIELLKDSLPGVPMLLTSPPGSFERRRLSRRRSTYSPNPRTIMAAKTIREYASRNGLAFWDLYAVVGGEQWACKNWDGAKLMRPDHVHYLPEGYTLQGKLLAQAIIKAYNNYVVNRH